MANLNLLNKQPGERMEKIEKQIRMLEQEEDDGSGYNEYQTKQLRSTLKLCYTKIHGEQQTEDDPDEGLFRFFD